MTELKYTRQIDEKQTKKQKSQVYTKHTKATQFNHKKTKTQQRSWMFL